MKREREKKTTKKIIYFLYRLCIYFTL